MCATDVVELLDELLGCRAPEAAMTWLAQACARAADPAEVQRGGARFHFAFSAATRHFGRVELALSEAEQARVDACCPGLGLSGWSLDQLARARLLVALDSTDVNAWVASLDALCADGDLQELIAVYQSLALLPHPQALKPRAAEGVRSNMQAVVEAVALRNPYPAAHLDDGPFSQMVLKCVFIGAGLHLIVGLDGRVTTELARMLVDYARERRAAKRSVPHDLWRCVGPVATGPMLADLQLTLEQGTEVEKRAAVLSLRDNPKAASLLAGQQDRLAVLAKMSDPWAGLAEAGATAL